MSRFFVFLLRVTTSMALAPCLSIADPVNGVATTAASTTSENKEGQVFDVKTAPYNGRGDGVTDDTVAIQRAINDVKRSGGTVYVPAGTWMFSTLRVRGANCVIQGAGKDATILKAIAGTAATLISFGGATAAPNSAIKDLTIDASGANVGSNYALLLYNSSSSEVANIHIISAYNIGIGFAFCRALRIHDSVVEDSRNGQSILTNDSDCSGTRISNCSVFNSAKDAIQILQSEETVDHCYISGVDRSSSGNFAGVYVARGSTGARQCTISNNIIRGCSSVGIDVSFGAGRSVKGEGVTGPDESEGIRVIGNDCSNNLGGGISTGSNGTLVAKNICRDNGSPQKPNSCGVGVVDAKNVIIKENIAGNTANGTTQKYGILFRHVYKDPRNATVADNDLRGNAVAPVIGQNNGKSPGPIRAGAGHVFAHNLGLDDGAIKRGHRLFHHS
jgi:hypothetical protein